MKTSITLISLALATYAVATPTPQDPAIPVVGSIGGAATEPLNIVGGLENLGSGAVGAVTGPLMGLVAEIPAAVPASAGGQEDN